MPPCVERHDADVKHRGMLKTRPEDARHMADGQRLSGTNLPHDDSGVVQVAMLRRRLRSRALLVILLGLVVLFYLMTVARLGQRRSPADRLAAATSMPGQSSDGAAVPPLAGDRRGTHE